METESKKRKYEKPAMQVVELQHRTMILAGSGDGREDYGLPVPGDWEWT